MKMGTWFRTAVGVCGVWACVQGAPAWGSPNAPSAVETKLEGAPQAAPSRQPEREAFAATYAQREQAAEAQKNFEGGGDMGLYIGGSTVAIVLLVLILIVVL